MAKIRGIKPEFWTADGIIEMSIPARLLYIGLWNYACDNGHIRDKPRQIKTRIMPGDDVEVDELLDEMVAADQIVREDGWITIPDLTFHQKPHKRWWSTCEKEGCVVPEGASRAPGNRGATVANKGTTVSNGVATADGEGDGEYEGDGDGDVKDAPASGGERRATKLPKNWKPTTEHLERALAADIDLGKQADKFKAHAEEKGRTAVNWNAAFTRWLMNAAEYAERDRPAQSRSSASLMPVHLLEDPPPGLNVEEYDAWHREQVAKRKAYGA